MTEFLDASWKLGLAAVLSGLVGLERSFAEKPAGIRTLMLVGFGAALFMTVAGLAGIDAGRAAAGVITGVGFLGAGTIIRGSGEVKGLTTAASIWTVAGIGIACSQGLWLIAIAAALGVVIVLWLLGRLEDLLERTMDARTERRRDRIKNRKRK